MTKLRGCWLALACAIVAATVWTTASRALAGGLFNNRSVGGVVCLPPAEFRVGQSGLPVGVVDVDQLCHAHPDPSNPRAVQLEPGVERQGGESESGSSNRHCWSPSPVSGV